MAVRTGKITIYSPDQSLPSADLGNITGTAQGFLDGAGNAIICPLPSARQLQNKLFHLKAWGRVTGGTTANFTPSLYYGLSATVGSDTIIKAATAAAVDSAAHSWQLEGDFVWDITSSKIQGRIYARIAGVAVTADVVGAVISSADPSANASQGFIISGLFSASNAGNIAFLDGFQIEVVE